jgi:hypothetical protein
MLSQVWEESWGEYSHLAYPFAMVVSVCELVMRAWRCCCDHLEIAGSRIGELRD